MSVYKVWSKGESFYDMWNQLRKFPRSLIQRVINLLTPGTPVYEPALWSPANDVQYNNNCYNYACDIRGTYAQPGVASEHKYRSLTCEEIGQAVVADGLVPIGCTKRCGRVSHKVALVISPGKTFHLYRRDGNGRWSH